MNTRITDWAVYVIVRNEAYKLGEQAVYTRYYDLSDESRVEYLSNSIVPYNENDRLDLEALCTTMRSNFLPNLQAVKLDGRGEDGKYNVPDGAGLVIKNNILYISSGFLNIMKMSYSSGRRAKYYMLKLDHKMELSTDEIYDLAAASARD